MTYLTVTIRVRVQITSETTPKTASGVALFLEWARASRIA